MNYRNKIHARLNKKASDWSDYRDLSRGPSKCKECNKLFEGDEKFCDDCLKDIEYDKKHNVETSSYRNKITAKLNKKANTYEGYEEREGLEGPYKSALGEIYYYDPKQGKYYNPKTDIYFEKDWDPSVGYKSQHLSWTEWGNKLDAVIKERTGGTIDLEEAWTQPNTTVHDLHDWFQKGLSPEDTATIVIQERKPQAMEMGKLNLQPLSVFNTDTANDALNKIKSSLDATVAGGRIYELGGPEHVAIGFSFSIDPKEEWSNNIFENSRHAKFMLENDGTLKHLAGHGMGKFRLARTKNIDDVIDKVNAFIQNAKSQTTDASVNYKQKIYAKLNKKAELTEAEVVGKFLVEAVSLTGRDGQDMGHDENEQDYITAYDPATNTATLKNGKTYDMNAGDVYIYDDIVYVHLTEPEDFSARIVGFKNYRHKITAKLNKKAEYGPTLEDRVPEEESIEPEEGDYIVTDAGSLGGSTEVHQNGKLLLNTVEEKDAYNFIKEHMEKELYFPNVWKIDDHGGVNLINLTEE